MKIFLIICSSRPFSFVWMTFCAKPHNFSCNIQKYKKFKTSGGPPVTSAPYIFHYMPWLGLLLSSFMECDHRCYMSHIPVYAKFTFLYKPPQLCSEANIYHLNTHNASGILPGRTSPVACSICFTSHKTQIIRNVSTHWWIWFTEICLLIPLLSCGMWRRVTF